MIIKEIDNLDLSYILNKYKDSYKLNITDFTHVFVAKEDNKIVGFIVFDIIYDRAEIIDLFILEEYRKKGLAFNLIHEVINDFNINNITLEVNKENESAINLYEKIGFKTVSIRKGYYDGTDGLLMLKEIR